MTKLGCKFIPFKKVSKLLPGISVCLIVKNEEVNLGQCLKSIDFLANEIVVVDTGSTDKTIEIAKQFGAKIFNFIWVDDFAVARNYSLSLASHKWILVIDADETISEDDHDIILQAIKGQYAAYELVKRSYVNRTDLGGFVHNDNSYSEAGKYLGWCAEPNHLLFKNGVGIKYSGIIHETITESLFKLKLPVARLDVPIHHYGRWDMSKKEDYYFRMCEIRAIQENTGHSWFVYGSHLDWFGKFDEADDCFTKSLELDPKYHRSKFGLGLVNFKLKHMSKAKMYFQDFLKYDYDELVIGNLIQIYLLDNNFDSAVKLYDNSKKGFYSSKVFGQLLLQIGNTVEAKKYLKQAFKLLPDYEDISNLYKQCLTTKELITEFDLKDEQ